MKRTKVIHLKNPTNVEIQKAIEELEELGYEIEAATPTSCFCGGYSSRYYLTIIGKKEDSSFT